MAFIIRGPVPSLAASTILPNPVLSDVEGLTDELVIKRAMDGTKRTYVKSGLPIRLSYNFTISRMKSLELRNFVKVFYSSDLQITDHNDDLWVVKFESNPFEFTKAGRAGGWAGGEVISIPLIFIGEKQ